ncbi:MAG: tetratricopeptide repeat protein [Anaerolineales bacterium]|nr:tetratricopeptide repeat protein [Anaerolineales bacterium]MCB8939125.1 tetratricopeptide repeat protein [Ardenticatenaceae bacterium]
MNQPKLTISLLGGVRILLDGTAVSNFPSRKADALLAYLACNPRAHPREKLATLFWPDNDQTRALANLSVILSSLRKQLDDYVLADRHTIAFNTERVVDLDVVAFEQAIEAAQRRQSSKISRTVAAQLDTAVSRYKGDFLAGFSLRNVPEFEAWVLLEQERLRQMMLDALADLVTFHQQRGQFADGIQHAQRLLALDPLQEQAHRQLMLLYALDNQRPAALAQYEQCFAILDEELGVEPDEETTKLYEQIKNNKATSQENIPPAPLLLRTPAPLLLRTQAPPHNLPAPATSFIGRTEELAQIENWLMQPNGRLLTLIGPGGIGKTRLAQEAARQQIGAFADGVWYVGLAALTRSDNLADAIAEAIHLPQKEGRDTQTQLIAYMRHKEMLLILDNLEQLVGNTAMSFLAQLLENSPELRILATSRERLRLQAERLLELGGLPFPVVGNLLSVVGKPNTDNRISITGYPAVQLFASRAQWVQADFVVAGWETAVTQICQLVHGLPLALELAATWVRVLTPDEIVAEIEQDISVLAAAVHDLPERHRSVRAVFEYSWQLLTPQEQTAMQQIAVFAGQFDRALAQAVADASLPLLQTLLDKSMLQRSESWFGLHPLIKQYAVTHLAGNPALRQLTRQRHALAIRDRVAEWGRHMHRTRQKEALAAIAALIEDVALAWQWAATHEATLLLAMLPGMLDYFRNGRHQQGIPLLETAVQQLNQAPMLPADPLLIPKLQGRLAELLAANYDLPRAKALITTCLATYRQHEAQAEIAYALRVMERLAHAQGDSLNYRRQLLDEALIIYQTLQDAEGKTTILFRLGVLEQLEGNYETAVHLGQQVIRLAEAAGDLNSLAFGNFGCGGALRDSGQYAAAIPYYERCLEVAEIVDNHYLLVSVLNHLAGTNALLGDYAPALKMFARCKVLAEQIGERRMLGYTLADWGETESLRGNYEASRELQLEGMAVLHEVGDQWGVAGTYLNLGDLEGKLGDWQAASQNYAKALATARSNDTLPMIHHALMGLAQYLLWMGYQTRKATFIVAYLMGQTAVTGPINALKKEVWAEIKPTDPQEATQMLQKAGSTPLAEIINILPPNLLLEPD